MTKEEQAIRFHILGMAADAGLTEIMTRYHAELQILRNTAKEKGEKDEAAFILAVALFGLEVGQ